MGVHACESWGTRPGHLVKNKHFNQGVPVLQAVSPGRYRSSPLCSAVPHSLQCITNAAFTRILTSCLCPFFSSPHCSNFYFRPSGSLNEKFLLSVSTSSLTSPSSNLVLRLGEGSSGDDLGWVQEVLRWMVRRCPMTLTRGKSPRVVPKYWPEVKPKSLCQCFL